MRDSGQSPDSPSTSGCAHRDDSISETNISNHWTPDETTLREGISGEALSDGSVPGRSSPNGSTPDGSFADINYPDGVLQDGDIENNDGTSCSTSITPSSGSGPITPIPGIDSTSLPGGGRVVRVVMETNLAPPSNAPECPVFLGANMSEYDIELESLAPPDNGTYSTDRLIPPSGSTNSLPPADGASTQPETQSMTRTAPVPNYKPIPLWWPFSMFLVAVLASLFAFLEHQIHTLLPPHHTLLDVDHPMGFANKTHEVHSPTKTTLLVRPRGTVLGRGETDVTPFRIQPLTGSAAQTSISSRNPTITLRARARPPESSYPTPFVPVHTYCGWVAPTWSVAVFVDGSPYTTACTSPVDNCWVLTVSVEVIETIETFQTDDPSWCPCRLGYEAHTFSSWGVAGTRYGEDWDSTDEGCKSAMLAIASLNRGYLRNFAEQTTFTIHSQLKAPLLNGDSGNILGPGNLRLGRYELTIPPTDLGPGIAPNTRGRLWPYPSTNAMGVVFMPLMTRSAGLGYDSDAFGNHVEPTESALFADSWHSYVNIEDSKTTMYLPGGEICFSRDPPNSESGDPKFQVIDSSCRRTPGPSDIVWWPLPRSPVRASTSAAQAPQTTSSTGSGQAPTPPRPLPSAAPLPTPTCCSTDVVRGSNATGSESAPQTPAWPLSASTVDDSSTSPEQADVKSVSSSDTTSIFDVTSVTTGSSST